MCASRCERSARVAGRRTDAGACPPRWRGSATHGRTTQVLRVPCVADDYLIEVLADPAHEEHKERLEWLGLNSADEFDPAAFDLAKVNSALSALATVLVKG